MDVLHPTCSDCGGTGLQGVGPCPACKPTPGRSPLGDGATVGEWVKWIQQQPTVEHGVEVLRRLLHLDTPPDGLVVKEPEPKD